MAVLKRWLPSALFQPAPDQTFTAWLFLRSIALIYFAAFVSLGVQIRGLAGLDGLLPLYAEMQFAYQVDGPAAFLRMPSIFWINAGDTALVAACVAGAGLAVLLLFSLWQRTVLILMFVLYLSLTHAGQTFLNFQWDYLLLEAGFLSIFLVNGPSRLTIFLFHFLLFRLRFMSGLSKLNSGDPSWINLEAVKLYFETQPLPHVGAWYVHQWPDWILRAGTGFTLFTELLVPFLIFLPRRFRLFAAAITISLQLMIIATSNHNFVNLLTILLCLFLLDDKIVSKCLPQKKRARITERQRPHRRFYHLSTVLTTVAIMLGTLPLSVIYFGHVESPALLRISNTVRPFGLGHIYHVFPTMQTERHELDIQGSPDGKHWESYLLPYKPGPLNRPPAFIIPHQPRLDWMIWFVPAQFERDTIWFSRLIEAISQNRKPVMDLLAHNPFPEKPPPYLRVLSWRYSFTTAEERKETGNWWKAELLGVFPNVPPRFP